MKKFLLSLVATCMVAMGANAQMVQSAKHQTMPYGVKVEKVAKTNDLNRVFKASPIKRAKDANSLVGDYIMDADNWYGDFRASYSFTITLEEGTIKPYSQSGEEVEDFTYNVVLNDFTTAGAKVYGYYNEEESFILLPVQSLGNSKEVFGASADYGDVIFSACITLDGSPQYYGYNMYLDVAEDGSLSIWEGDFSEDIEAGDMEDGSIISGWYNYLPDIPASEGNAWNYGFNAEIFVPNATMSYATTGKGLGGTGSGWARVSKRVYVEDWDSEVVISNFLGKCPISVTINNDGTCELPLGQPIDDYDYEEYDNSYPWGLMRLVGVGSDEEGYLHPDWTIEVLNGNVFDEGLQFYSLEYREAEGEEEAGWYYTDEIWRYFCVATAGDMSSEATYPFFMGYVCNLDIEYDAKEPEGITNVAAKNNNSQKTFNLMGQQVKNAKGIVIRDGKKFVK